MGLNQWTKDVLVRFQSPSHWLSMVLLCRMLSCTAWQKFVSIFAVHRVLQWGWKHDIPLKQWQTCARLHSAKSKKSILFKWWGDDTLVMQCSRFKYECSKSQTTITHAANNTIQATVIIGINWILYASFPSGNVGSNLLKALKYL